MLARVINVPKTVDPTLHLRRRNHIVGELERLKVNYAFVEAVDGKRLSPSDRAGVVDELEVERYPNWLTPGLIGAVMSHLQAYRDVIASGHPVGLVLEDDVLLPPNFQSVIREVSGQMRPGEVVLLYYRTKAQARCRFAAESATRLGAGTLVTSKNPDTLVSAAAYLISIEACRSLLAHRIPIRDGTDSWGRWLEAGAYGHLRCVYPRPVQMRNDFKSTVDYLGGARSVRQRVSALVARTKLFPLHQIFHRLRVKKEKEMSNFVVEAGD